MVSPQNKTTTYHYDAVGNRDSVINPNSTASGYHYDALNRLVLMRNYGPSNSILAHYAYTLNAAGIRTGVTEKDSSKVAYTYDSLYRLKKEKRTGSHPDSAVFTYDAVGNRLTHLRNGESTTYSYNTRDQLTGESGAASISYTYDSAGRTLSKAESGGTTYYRWLDDDRLDSLYGPGASVKYQYDADGRRVKDSTGSTVKQYLIDPLLPYGQVLVETNGAGSLNAEYVFGLDRISQRRSGVRRYYLADGQGSVRMLADSIGAVTDSNYYTAFGDDLFHSGSTVNDFKYVGEQLDGNSGFYYNRSRWYDSREGRFFTVDIYEGDPQASLSLHRYLYANASPISFTDPTGEITLPEVMMGVNILTTTFSISMTIAAPGVSLGSKFFQIALDLFPGSRFLKYAKPLLGPLKITGRTMLGYITYGRVTRSFTGQVGWASTLAYRTTFRNFYPLISDVVEEVHHAIPQSVLAKFPKYFNKYEIHSLENLRGIPKGLGHYHDMITAKWNVFLRKGPSKEAILEFAKKIDDEFGDIFVPPFR